LERYILDFKVTGKMVLRILKQPENFKATH